MVGGIVLATGDGDLVTKHTIPMAVANILIARAIVWVASSSNSITEPLALVALMAESPVLVVYLKKFTFHTKHLENVLHIKYFASKQIER